MLRAVLIAVAAAGFLIAVGLIAFKGAVPGVGALVFWCAVVLIGLLIERRRYKKILSAPPGPDWTPTGERFIDTASGKAVAVYFHAPTGKRAYVAAEQGVPG
jgi:hypothetical protein